MTGIERLREFVAGISPITVVCGVTRTSYDREHMEVAGKRLRDFLADIADQIDREQGERVSRVRILAVVTKMERHVLGHEGMEDSPVARWARELRAALGLGGGTGRFKVVCHDVTDDIDCDCDPSLLIHERPAFKCRDCAHWQKDPTADSMGVCWFLYHEYEGQDCYAARRGDIGACEEFMPRAKALASKEATE